MGVPNQDRLLLLEAPLCAMNASGFRSFPVPITASTFVRSTALLLLVGFLALAGIVGTTIWLVEQNQIWFDQTTEARVARAATVSLRNALQDAETGQRGFLLTGEERYLEP